MYVCICNAVSDGKIHQAAAEGACTLADLQDRLGVATGCGSCAESAMACLREARGQATESDEVAAFQPA